MLCLPAAPALQLRRRAGIPADAASDETYAAFSAAVKEHEARLQVQHAGAGAPRGTRHMQQAVRVTCRTCPAAVRPALAWRCVLRVRMQSSIRLQPSWVLQASMPLLRCLQAL